MLYENLDYAMIDGVKEPVWSVGSSAVEKDMEGCHCFVRSLAGRPG